MKVVEDWDVFKEYTNDRKPIFYQVVESSKSIEIRICVWGVGFKKTFKNSQDPLYQEILSFCEDKKCIKVQEGIRDEYFFL